MSMSTSELTPLVRKRLESAPRFSRWHVAAFFLIGVAAALPPTSFITPKQYFLYKLRTLPNHSYPYGNQTHGNGTRLNPVQAQYESFATVTLSVAIVLFNLITVFIASKIRLMTRMVVPFIGVSILLAFSLALTKLNTDNYQKGFFWVTIITIFFLTGFSIVAFASAFGFASILPPQFLVSVLAGTAFGSVIVAVLNILTLLIDRDPQTSALYFFCTALFIVLSTIVVIVLTFRSGVIKFYINTLRSSRRPDLAQNVAEDAYEFDRTMAQRTSSIINVISNKQIIYYVMKKTWLLQVNAFLFHLSFGACFPALASAIEPMHHITGSLWTEVLFTPVMCFLLAYTAQFIGRPLPRLFQVPSFKHWRWITLITVLRFGFIPLYVFCNVQPRSHLVPVAFNSDAWPALFNIIWGFTTGYFGSLITLYLPKLVTGELKENASIVAVTFTAIGQALGGVMSVFLVKMLDQGFHRG